MRKDRQRALARIETWVGLDPEERRVFTAFRVDRVGRRRRAPDGAHPGAVPPPAGRANTKVDAAFTGAPADGGTPPEGFGMCAVC